MNFVNFNINQYVWVKLTKRGLDELEKEHNSYRYAYPKAFDEWKAPEVDNEGYSKFQLWSLISEFGSSMKFGEIAPFCGDIRFDKNDLEDV